MNALLRLAIAALVLVALPVCAFGLRLAHDPAGLVGLRDVMRSAQRDEELQRLERATRHRLESRRQVVQEVIARRLSLGEAMKQFRELEGEWPDYAPRMVKFRGPQWSEQERHYELITTLVQGLLHDRPEEAAAALRRLEEDYRQLPATRPAPSLALARRAIRGR